ncbi:MAG TPA: glycosyltransferase, partial [Solirubrobacteraceae bacterium]
MRICMLLEREDVRSDGRVRREIRALTGAGHDVVLLHRGPAAHGDGERLDGARLRSVEPRGRARRLLAALPGPALRAVRLVRYVAAAVRERPAAVHAHDVAMLPSGWAAARLARAALVYDTHEYAAGVPYHGRGARLAVRAVQRALVPRCAAV